MTKDSLYHLIQKNRLAVISSISPENKPGCALIGIAVSENLEIIFDTVTTSRKYRNLLYNPYVALVIGWEDEITVQYEGLATMLTNGDDLYREIYFSAFPDGRDRAVNWPGIVHFKIQPKWIRYSNFNDPAIIEEMIL